MLGSNQEEESRAAEAETPETEPKGPGAVADAERTDAAMPDPDDPRKPTKPTDLEKQSWVYALRKTGREFSEDQCTDLAAGLTYYSVLAVFPALLAVISLVGVFGQGAKTVDTILKVLAPVVSSSTLDNLRPTLRGLADNQTAGVTLVIGLMGALWSASAYVGAFGRAMNRIYEVQEGRPVWKLRPLQLLVTVLTVVLCAAALLILIVSGPVAKSVGDAIGLGATTVTVWNIAKWPLLALVVIGVVALLYYATPNVKQPRFRWISVGAFVAIMVWLLASVGFAFYVANFSSYDKTYGSVAGVVIALLWLWLTNLALLFGAELDAELERGRQLQAGMPAEETIQLPVRDTRGIVKSDTKREKDLARGRRLREGNSGHGDPADRPFGRRH
jgi:membrane protein